jgi:hypothetical protein
MKPVIVRPKVPTKMDAWKPDNGHMHYGVGVRGSYCGVEVEHRETANVALVNCPDCLRELRRRT